MHIPHLFIHLLMTCGLLPPFATVNNAIMDMGVQIPLWDPAFNSFEYIPRSGVAGSSDNSIFNFLRSWHTVFHNVPFYTPTNSTMRVPVKEPCGEESEPHIRYPRQQEELPEYLDLKVSGAHFWENQRAVGNRLYFSRMHTKSHTL